jgi:peptidoglycan/LPS O-acetylase OafA/YrhL
MSTEAHGELRALTVLRFVFALYALAYHVLLAWNGVVSSNAGPLAAIVASGYVSVSGFFVLSGFVLAYTYAVLDRRTLASGTWRFYWARFARIYPVHLFGIALSVPLLFAMARAAHAPEALIGPEAAREVLAVALLVQAWIPERALDLNGPSWSLSVEVFFYASFPVWVRLFAPLRVRALMIVAVSSYAIALLVPIVHPLENGIADASLADRVVLFDPLVHLPEFLLGVVTGLLFLRQRPEGPVWRWVALASSLALLSTLAHSTHLPIGILHNGLLDPLIALLVFSLAAAWPPSGLAATSPALLLLLVLGRASYSLYILHKPVYLFMAYERRLGLSHPSATFIALYIALSLVVSVVCFRLIEEPARRAMRPKR